MLLSFKKLTKYCFPLLFLVAAGACKKHNDLSNLAGLTAFSIQNLNVTFTIDETQGTISNKDSLPFQTNVSALVAVFTAVPNATVKVGTTVQQSGTTANNFSSAVTYVAVAQNGSTTRSYTVQVNVAKVDPKTVSWQQLTADAGWGNYHNLTAGVFNNTFYAFGGTLGSFNSLTFGAFSSTDGTTWSRVRPVDNNGDSVPHGEYSTLIPFNNKLWFLGGHRPGVGFGFDFVTSNTYSTSDGLAYTVSAPVNASDRFSVRERAGAVVFNNKLFVIGGSAYPFGGNTNAVGVAYNDVWSSTDGTTWTQVTAAAAFPARVNPAVFVYNNKIWVAGGATESGNVFTYFNDVWNSSDGVNWTQVTTASIFPARYGHSIAVYNNQLFLVGGENGDGVQSDLWVSSDTAVNWTKVQSGDVRALPASYQGRVFSSVFVQNNALYIIGGLGVKNSNNQYTYRNDVWKGVLAK